MELRFTAETPPQLRVISNDTVEYQRLLGALTHLGLGEPSDELAGVRADISAASRSEQPETATNVDGPVEFVTDPDHQPVLLAAAEAALTGVRRLKVLGDIVSPPAANSRLSSDPATLHHLWAISDTERTLMHMEKVFSAQPLPAEEQVQATVNQE